MVQHPGGPTTMVQHPGWAGLVLVSLLLVLAAPGARAGPGVQVEDLTGRQLEAALEAEPSLAIFWYSKNCKTCDRVLGVLERVGQEVAENGITLVRVSDKKSAKTHNIRNFPALSLFRGDEPSHFDGDLTSASAVLDFLSSSDLLDEPGQIEDVSASQLEALVEQQDYVAVFFYDAADKASQDCLASLESIDDDLDEKNILAVKMADTTEAKNYGVKSFPSIIVFVKKIPELYEGDVRDEAAVLGWALTQAGVKIAAVEVPEDILAFPAADAGDKAPPTPKVTPKEAPKVKVPEKNEEEEEAPTDSSNSTAEDPELSATVDTIKNDNNVVVFFSPYKPGPLPEGASLPVEDSVLLRQLLRHMEATYSFDHRASQEEEATSCWPLTCASAAGHKKLNIDKLTTKPLVKTREGKKNIADLPGAGWLDWLLSSGEHLHVEVEADMEEEAPEEVEDEEEDEVEEVVLLQPEDDPVAEVPEVGEAEWYMVRLLGPAWWTVDLLGQQEPDHGFTSEKDWFMLDLLGDLDLSIDLLGWRGDKRPWWSVNLLGDDGKPVECVPLDHDQRAWSDVSLMGTCSDGMEHWWQLDWLQWPGQQAGQEDVFGLDLLGTAYRGERDWWAIDLLGDRSGPEPLEEDTPKDTSGKKSVGKSGDNEALAVKAAAKEKAAKDAAGKLEAAQREASAKIAKAIGDKPNTAKKEAAKEAAAEKEAAAKEAAKREATAEMAAAKTSSEKAADDTYGEQSWFSNPDPSDVAREAARVEAEKKAAAAVEADRLDAERIQKEERAAAAAVAEAKRKAAAEAARLEAERIDAEKAAAAEAARVKVAVEAAAAEARAEAEKLEAANRLEAARLESARLEQEAKEQTGSWIPAWSSSEDGGEKSSKDIAKEKKKNKTTKVPDNIEQLLDGENPELLEKLTAELYARIKKDQEGKTEEAPKKMPSPSAAPAQKKKMPKKAKAEEPSKPVPTVAPTDSVVVEEKTVKLSETAEVVKNYKSVFLFTYENMDKIAKKIINGLDKVEETFSGKDIVFLSVDIDEVPDLTVASVPSLIYFKNGEPEVYQDNLMNEEAIREWVEAELASNLDVIEDLNSEQIHDLMAENEYVLVYLYQDSCEACDEAIKQLEQIDDDADAVNVMFVKTNEPEFAAEFGIDVFPAILYFENQQPSIYDGDAAEETELLTWLLYQMKEDTIENINRELLTKMIDEFEFLAVFFYDSSEECTKVLRHLELIDDEAGQYGVRMVKLDDPLMSKKYGHRDPPGLGYFRKGNYVKFDGDLYDDEEMLDWLTDPNVMEISDQIEKVNKKMFEKLITRNEFLTVFFYSDTDCKQCDGVLQELENIDDDADTAGIPIVKLEDKALAKSVGVYSLPAVVFFKNFGEEAVVYTGDLKREESILEWLMVQKDPSNDAIEELEGENLRKIVESSDAVAVFVYSHEECDNCLETLTELENIDDDVGKQKIAMVKTTDSAFAEEVGVETYPALVFFKEGVPNLYEGDLTVEEEVLDWLIEMKVESHIELITRPMLETMVVEVQYLAVFFYKQNCRTCDQIILELENIDDECDMFGIQMVKLKDPPLAKRYGIKTFPALVYFRNGNPLAFDGDLKSEDSVLEWMTDDDNRELEDEIEAVNFRMLDKLLETSSLIAVFFYDEECIECDAILESLENIDDEADSFGIDMVKNNDNHAARQYNIYNTPALVYFRRMTPIVFDGDLMDYESILEWLTSQDVFETKDEIEEVNRKLLEKLLDENEFVAVYFYEDNCVECDEAIEGLEKIDDETDALDITMVKVNDARYAKKYGVNKMPALVYFRRKFPSIYRDNLFDEDTILEWLTSNRYKQLELGVFMYAIVSLAITFMCYTAFLMFGLKPKEPERKKEE